MEKEDWLGTSGHGGEFLGFSFFLIYPRLEVEEASNLKMPMKADKKKKKTNKGMFSLANELGKRQYI